MVILRYLVKNIFEKKFQSFLLFLSIVVAATLVFSSLTVTQTMQELNMEMVRSEVGNSDIIIEPINELDAFEVDTAPLTKIGDSCEYVLEVLKSHALYGASVEEEEYFATWGADIQTLSKFTELTFVGDAPESLAEDEVILSEKTADRLGYKVGDEIDLNVHLHPGTYKIVALCQSKGIFIDEAHVAVMIMNRDRLYEIFETNGVPNTVFLGLKDGVAKEEIIEKLSPQYSRCVVEDSSTRTSSNSTDSSVSFIVVSLFAVLVSAFIIYTSYRVITTERLPVIGTFRSVGATKKKHDSNLLSRECEYRSHRRYCGNFTGHSVIRRYSFRECTFLDYGCRLISSVQSGVYRRDICLCRSVVCLKFRCSDHYQFRTPSEGGSSRGRPGTKGERYSRIDSRRDTYSGCNSISSFLAERDDRSNRFQLNRHDGGACRDYPVDSYDMSGFRYSDAQNRDVLEGKHACDCCRQYSRESKSSQQHDSDSHQPFQFDFHLYPKRILDPGTGSYVRRDDEI